MVTSYLIDSTDWKPISSAGKTISAWIDERNLGAKKSSEVRIYCSKTKPSADDFIRAKQIFRPKGNDDVMQITPEIEDTIVWAKCSEGSEATVNVSNDGIATIKKMDVSIQDSTNIIISSHIVSELGSAKTATEATVNTNTVTLDAGHGFVNPDPTHTGQMFVIPGYYMGEIKTVTGNIVTLFEPFSYTFPIGTPVLRCDEYLNKNGSITQILYGFKAAAGRKFDIEGFHMTFISSSAMDDSLFASLTELANGMLCRIKKSATQYNYVFNAKSNQDLKLFGEIEYSSKAPSGKYGMTFSLRFKDHYGAVVRLNGDLAQQLEIWVRDDLSTLGEIECIIHGHVVED